MSCLRRPFVGILSRRPELNPIPFRAEFELVEVALTSAFLLVIFVSPVVITPPVRHTRLSFLYTAAVLLQQFTASVNNTNYSLSLCNGLVTSSSVHGRPNVLWHRATFMCASLYVEKKKCCTEPPKSLCNFYSVYIIYKCGRGPHNTTQPTACLRPTFFADLALHSALIFIIHQT